MPRIPHVEDFKSQKEAVNGGVLFLLPCEVVAIDSRLEHLGVSQKKLSELLGDAMTQSSETFHDNAPAEAINSAGYILNAEANQLIRVRESAARIPYPTDAIRSAIGNILTIQYDDEEDANRVLLTGYSRNIAPDTLDAMGIEGAISAPSPLGYALLGSEMGSIASYKVNGRQFSVGVLAVEVTAIAVGA